MKPEQSLKSDNIPGVLYKTVHTDSAKEHLII